jgi:cytoskeleton protein RodZ
MTSDTTDATANPNDPGLDSSRQGPGRLIRLGRERARIGVAELAALTKLAPATLEALERDDFGMLSEPVYVRGYYRKCAKALALSEQELLSAYEKMVGPRAPQAPTKLLLGGTDTGSSLKKNRRRSTAPWWLWLIGVVLLVVLAAWFLREDPNSHHAALSDTTKPLAAADDTVAAPPAAAKPQSINEAATAPADSGADATAQAETTHAASPSAAPVASAAPPAAATPSPMPAPAPATAAAAAAPAPAGTAPAGPAPEGALTLDFTSTSWVRVEDSRGKVLLSGVIQAGDHQVLPGKAPYSLFLGNAPGVNVQFKDQVVDLKPYTKSNDTAHLTVPARGG